MRSIETLGVLLTLALAGQPALARQDEAPPRPEATAETQSAVEAVEALIADYQAAMDAFYDGYVLLETDEQRSAYAADKYPDADSYAKRAWAFVDAAPSSEAALKAVIWAMNVSRGGENLDRGVGILDAHFIQSEALGEIVDTIADSPTPRNDAFLRRVIAETPHRKVKAMATYALCSELGGCVTMKAMLASATQEDLEMYSQWYSADALAYVRSVDGDKLDAERLRLLKSIIADYADITKYGQKMSDLAASELYELQHLQVGMLAPEIEDQNLDGETMKLSDFRGKVVMLDFWGDW